MNVSSKINIKTHTTYPQGYSFTFKLWKTNHTVEVQVKFNSKLNWNEITRSYQMRTHR